jgi:hypothetical protein
LFYGLHMGCTGSKVDKSEDIADRPNNDEKPEIKSEENRPSVTESAMAALVPPVVEPIYLPERFLISKLEDRPLTDGLTYRVKDILERRDKLYPEFKKPENLTKVKDLEIKVAELTSEIDRLKTANNELTEERDKRVQRQKTDIAAT